ncbi:PD-(D/E)XK nuclease family protein [Salirhabdus salicampi]|uniref:PD-(D/E)XK nuclease family protein n=1 Tax=Salirhabdus salicampi TaxID=476102 RepID=UPI0020C2900F|nr:PD-(D/E)XK nuclease family protein [Salirhabdus salicampi]MCP8615951.1 PD-(D/E)XK nuclease family protein [Salirhabdus salicampi]
MYEVKKYPEFSWSLSRHKTLMDCARKYGLHYYESHNGWRFDSPESSKKAYRLKKITNIPMLFGQIFHELVESAMKDLLQRNHVPSKEALIEKARRRLNSAYLDSRDRKSLWFDKPNRYNMLFEMYYNGELDPDVIKDYRERLDIVFSNLFHSKSFQDITTRQETMKFHQAEDFRYTYVNDVKIFAVMDLLYRDTEQGKWVIVDWKTGKESDSDYEQLAIYAYYLMQEFNVPLEQIEIRNEYLLTGHHRTYVLDERDIQTMLHRLTSSVQLMKGYQADILANEPLSIEEFPMTEQAQRCQRCNFKEICLT